MRELRRRLRLAQEALAHVGLNASSGGSTLIATRRLRRTSVRPVDDGHPAPADLRVDAVLRPDRGDEAVEQVGRSPAFRARAARRSCARRPRVHLVGDEQRVVHVVGEASAWLASDVMCWCICGPAPQPHQVERMFCSASAQVSSLAATASLALHRVDQRAALPLEVRQPPHALLAAPLERVGRGLERLDLALQHLARAGDVVPRRARRARARAR